MFRPWSTYYWGSVNDTTPATKRSMGFTPEVNLRVPVPFKLPPSVHKTSPQVQNSGISAHMCTIFFLKKFTFIRLEIIRVATEVSTVIC